MISQNKNFGCCIMHCCIKKVYNDENTRLLDANTSLYSNV